MPIPKKSKVALPVTPACNHHLSDYDITMTYIESTVDLKGCLGKKGRARHQLFLLERDGHPSSHHLHYTYYIILCTACMRINIKMFLTVSTQKDINVGVRVLVCIMIYSTMIYTYNHVHILASDWYRVTYIYPIFHHPGCHGAGLSKSLQICPSHSRHILSCFESLTSTAPKCAAADLKNYRRLAGWA